MYRLTMVMIAIMLVYGFVPSGNALAQTNDGALIWRPRISPTDVPKSASPPPSCDDNPNDNIGCSQSPLESTKPIDLLPSYQYTQRLPYECSDGKIRADIMWQGSIVPQLSIGGTSYALGGSNSAQVEAPFSNGSIPSVVIRNLGSRTVRISRFGVTMGCNVQSNIENVWVDHNVQQGNLKGMRIHVAFSVFNQKGADSVVVAYFSKQNGQKITTSNGSQLAVRRHFTPTYTGSSYRDVDLFMPYRDIPGAEGVHYLRFRIRLVDAASSDFFGRSEYLNFNLTR